MPWQPPESHPSQESSQLSKAFRFAVLGSVVGLTLSITGALLDHDALTGTGLVVIAAAFGVSAVKAGRK